MRYTHFITLPTSDFIRLKAVEGIRSYAILPDTVDHVLSVKINGIELKYTFNTISKELTLLPVGRSNMVLVEYYSVAKDREMKLKSILDD